MSLGSRSRAGSTFVHRAIRPGQDSAYRKYLVVYTSPCYSPNLSMLAAALSLVIRSYTTLILGLIIAVCPLGLANIQL